MAIDMPPAMPPLLADQVTWVQLQQRATGQITTGTIAGDRIEVIGFPYLNEGQVQNLIEVSQTPSQFIRALNALYRRQGNLLVQLLYLKRGSTVYVYVLQTTLRYVEGPESITQHFEPLVGDPDLTVAEFERRRILADMKAQREGVNYSISYEAADNLQSTTLVFTPVEDPEADPNQVYLEVSNQGNRYVGRYFAGAGFRHWFDSGLGIKLDYQTAVVDWGEADGGKHYDAAVFSLDYPSTYGLYGIEGLHSEYSREATAFDVITSAPLGSDLSEACVGPQSQLCAPFFQDPLSTTSSQELLLDVDGQTSSLNLNGEQILFSNARHRLSLLEQLEWVDDEIEERDQGLILDESYGSAGLGARYLVRRSGTGPKGRALVHVLLKAGVSDDSGTLGSDIPEEEVGPSKRTARFLLLQPNISAYMDLGARLRLMLDLSAQISDGDQLPQMQQYVLGGISKISAFLPGVLIGDSGTFGRLTLSGTERGSGSVQLIPSVFVENGKSWFENTSGPFADTRSISDAGIRLLLKIGSVYELEMTAARSIDDENLSEEHLDAFEASFFARMRLTL